jgi:hypothetical protein
MSKATIIKTVTKVKVENAKILSVEKGNIFCKASCPVIAFTVDATANGKNIKAIVKGAMAETLYHGFLKEGKSVSKFVEQDGDLFDIYKNVTISFTGDFKEERTKEFVVEDIHDIKFNYEYAIAE